MEINRTYLSELKKYFWENNISPNEYQLERLAQFASLIRDKNEQINLVSRKDIKNIVEKHVFISSYISEFFPEKTNRFLDIGTGGGLPGIPLAITNPLMRGVLVDSTGKKINAVQGFIDKLKLSNVVAENDRVESKEFVEKYKSTFDIVVSRSTVPIILLFRYSLPLLKDKSYILSLKGGDIDAEYRTAEMKYRSYIKKSTIIELAYKPNNIRNEIDKKLVLIEINK